MVHYIVYSMVHDMVHDIVHYMVHYPVHFMVHYLGHYVGHYVMPMPVAEGLHGAVIDHATTTTTITYYNYYYYLYYYYFYYYYYYYYYDYLLRLSSPARRGRCRPRPPLWPPCWWRRCRVYRRGSGRCSPRSSWAWPPAPWPPR